MKFIKIYYIILALCLSSTLFIHSNIKETSSVFEKTIVIDAGHGGLDGGCVGVNGSCEKDINLKITYKLKDIIESNGYKVILTRQTDDDLSSDDSSNKKREDIHKRVRIINESNCLLFISIHCNKYVNNKIYGSQVFYSNVNKTNESKELAKEIMDSLKRHLKNTNRVERKIENKYLLDNTNKIGVICEVGFLSNEKEEALLLKDTYQESIAKAIYDGVSNYLDRYSLL